MADRSNQRQHVNEFGEPRFVHKTVAPSGSQNNQPVIVSTCTKCNKYIAATQDLELLNAVESAHECYIPAPDPVRDAA